MSPQNCVAVCVRCHLNLSTNLAVRHLDQDATFIQCVLLIGIHNNISEECSRFITSMKGKYQERRINREKQWPPCHSNKLVRLELVEREKGEGYSANTQRGREEKNVKRTPLAYDDLFKVEGGKKPVRKVLVEGDAGIGKTTLCIAVSEDWANGKLFQQFELVLLLPLRMKAVASAGSLAELLKLLHSSPRLCDSVARYLEEEEGKSVLIIADGWDELSESKRQEESYLYQFLFGQNFCLMSVVVTSRPSTSAPLRELPDIDRFVEVRGFSKEHIVEYIQSEFASDQEKAGRLLEQLEDNPLVESVCSVPLNCAIVCHLWRTLKEALPSTMTELYTKIILNLVLRNIRKIDTYKSILNLSNFESLPADLQQSWWLLCEFAFQALEKDQLVFSQEELEAFFPEGLALDKRILCFGLLQSAESILEAGFGVSFHFLHLTFQEYLAALHLARQLQDKQLEVVMSQELGGLLSLERSPMVWRFFFGINHFTVPLTVLYTSSFMQQFCEHLCVVDDSVYSDKISLCHCAFEARNDLINNGITQYLVKHPFDNDYITYGRPRTAHDCSAVLYTIANMPECGDVSITLKYFGKNHIRELIGILASKKEKLLIVVLELSDSRLTSSGLQALERAVRGDLLANLEVLVLWGSLTSEADTNATWLTTFVDALIAHCPLLRSVDLSKNNLGVPGALVISKMFELNDYNRLILTDIYLDNTSLGDEGLITLIRNLDVIECLSFDTNDIHASGISHLADAVCSGKLKFMSIFSSLYLNDNPLGLESTTEVGRMLSSSHCQVREIYLCRCKLTAAASGSLNTDSGNTISCQVIGQQLRQMPQNTTIGDLHLDGNSFTGERIHILASFMYLCPCLGRLYTKDCSITSDDFIWLLDKLTKVKSSSTSTGLCSELRRWDLDNNQIDDRGVSALMDYLPLLFPRLGCEKYDDIHLDNNPISSEIKKRLEEKLREHREVNCSLTYY